MKQAYKVFLTALLAAATLHSCSLLEEEEDDLRGEPVARVYDSFLYEADLEEVLADDLSGEDSISFVQNYINVWAKNQLMVYKAEYNLTEEQKSFEEQIQNYRNDLLKYAYLQKYVDEKLDTNISPAEIRAYYKENQANFLLKENILRFRYLVVPEDAPQVEKVKRLFYSDDEKDRKELEDYALSYARLFSTKDTAWISFNEFTEIIPVQTFNQQEFLNNREIQFSREGLLYLVEISDYKIKDSPSPLPYVYNLIKNIILNKRRLSLIENLEKNLLNDAIKKKEFETY